MASAHDERPHAPGADPAWVEAYLFDLIQADASLAMSIEMLLWPQHKRVSFHASVVRADLPLVALVDASGRAPKPPSLEMRSSGIWADIGIQTPLDHMTVDIEAFAVTLEEPDDVFDGAYGMRTALGCEIEWETAGELITGASLDSYEMPCIVHGELLIDSDTIEVDGWGWRSHRWGTPTPADRARFRGRGPDGTWMHLLPEADLDAADVIGRAPMVDPSLGTTPARLHQDLVRLDDGSLGWARRTDID